VKIFCHSNNIFKLKFKLFPNVFRMEVVQSQVDLYIYYNHSIFIFLFLFQPPSSYLFQINIFFLCSLYIFHFNYYIFQNKILNEMNYLYLSFQ
jgi:hypothetical protein